jgi:uncharacterized OB-fold protein
VVSEESLPSAPHSVDDYVRGYSDDGKLRGFRCPSCAQITATWGLACARCGHIGLEETELTPRGKIGAFTVLHVPGDDFLNDAPYAYVVVELDGGGRITGWMPSVHGDSELSIGERVRFQASYKPGVQFVRESEGSGPT